MKRESKYYIRKKSITAEGNKEELRNKNGRKQVAK